MAQGHGPCQVLLSPPSLQGGAGARVLLWVQEGELHLEGKGSIFKAVLLPLLLPTASEGGCSAEVSAGRGAGSQDPEEGRRGTCFLSWGLTPREPLPVSKPGLQPCPFTKTPWGNSVVKFTEHKIHPFNHFKVDRSGAHSMGERLCSRHRHSAPAHVHHARREPHTLSSRHSSPLPQTDLRDPDLRSLDLPVPHRRMRMLHGLLCLAPLTWHDVFSPVHFAGEHSRRSVTAAGTGSPTAGPVPVPIPVPVPSGSRRTGRTGPAPAREQDGQVQVHVQGRPQTCASLAAGGAEGGAAPSCFPQSEPRLTLQGEWLGMSPGAQPPHPAPLSPPGLPRSLCGCDGLAACFSDF